VTSPAELAAGLTDLSGEALDHLQRLLAVWGVLADLSFSDLLLVTPVRDTAGAKVVILGQMRPTTAPTLLGVDMVGQVLEAADWPPVAEALSSGAACARPVALPAAAQAALMARATAGPGDTGELPAVPEVAAVECVPVRHGGKIVALLVRIGAVEGHRRSGRLERVYRSLFDRLAAMVANGVYPFAGEDTAGADTPRVGDGLLLVDAEGRITFASPNAMNALHRMGVGAAVEGRRLADIGVEEMAVDRALATGHPVIEEVERRPDVVVLVHCTPLLTDGTVTGAMVLLRDVTDLRRRDRLLLSKDAAIREVHHRVKNNLQTISSLLSLQARRLEPGRGREALREAERRVRSIAVVHEILSREPGEQVPFDEIVTALVRMAEDSVVAAHPVEIRVTGDLGDVPAGIATPLAVVLAELLQNAVEHAFVGAEGVGHVEVVLAATPRRLTVQVRDDGRGLPEDFDIERTTSLGLSIVRDLVTSQLGGTIAMEARHGTLVAIEVPIRDGHLANGP